MRVEASFLARVEREAKGYTVWHTAQGATRMNENVREARKMEKQRRILLCFPSFILVFCLLCFVLFVFYFILGDAAGIREGYGETGR